MENKFTYVDFYSKAAVASPQVIDNAVSILKQLNDYISDTFSTVHSAWWQDYVEDDLSEGTLTTATCKISKDGYDSYYIITVTTKDVSSDKCKLSIELITTNGKTISLYSNTYALSSWSSYKIRFFYLLTSRIFLFALPFISNDVNVLNSDMNSSLLYFVKSNDNISYYGYNSKLYNDYAQSTSITSTPSNYSDPDKAVLYNIYLNSSALNGLYILKTNVYSNIIHGFYCELIDYGKYYCSYNTSSSAYAIKLDDD